MQCGIPVQELSVLKRKYLPVHRIINQYGKFVYIIKQILTKQTELSFMIALFVDMSIPGAIHSIIQ